GAPAPAGVRQHWIRRGIAVAILAVLAVGAALYLGRDARAPRAEGPGAAPRALEVAVETLAPRTVAATPRFLGQVEASQVVEIRSRVKGFLLERAFEEGQRVEQGQLLFLIDPK